MKRIKSLLLLVTMALLAGCSTGTDPVKVAEQFAEAYCKTDFDKCNTLMIKDTKKRFTPSSEMSELEKEMLEGLRNQSKKMKYKISLNKEKTEVGEDFAEVTFDITSASDPDFKEELNIDLDKDEKTGKWAVYDYNLS